MYFPKRLEPGRPADFFFSDWEVQNYGYPENSITSVYHSVYCHIVYGLDKNA